MDSIKKRIVWTAALLGAAGIGLAFTPLGPFKPWQTAALGYTQDSAIGGPMTPHESYRWNVPTVYYAYDQSFLIYFGQPGVEAIEEMIEMFNSLPPASEITNDATRIYVNGEAVPFDTKLVNFQAQLSECPLWDLKSVAMVMILEELGLAWPERYVWSLRSRTVDSVGGQNFTNYITQILNWDPITLRPSSRINDAPYNYNILDPVQPGNYATTFPFKASQLDLGRPVAGNIPIPGEFFTGFTHDDVGGLRYLLTENRFVNEDVSDDVVRGLPQRNSFQSPWIPFTTLSNILGNTNLNVPNLPGVTNVAPGDPTTNFVRQALRPGVDKLNFVRAHYDSLLGINFIAVTNQFTDRYVSNGVPRRQVLQRAVVEPDLLFLVQDVGLVDNLIPGLSARTVTAGWTNNDVINGAPPIGGGEPPGGPGTITPGVRIAFTDQFPFFLNTFPPEQPPFLNEDTSFNSGCWGSFDGTTNEPIIFPIYLNWTLQDLRRNFGAGGGGGN